MKQKHESYGMIGASRLSCSTPMNLFGSSIKHSNPIKITIKEGEVDRDLNRDWYYGRETICEVYLSQTQFAEMITSLNISDGVPCTIAYANGERKEESQEIKMKQIFEEEFQEKVDKISSFCEEDLKDIEKMLSQKKPLKVSERKEVLSKVTKLIRILNDSIPFLQKSFNEAMDKTILESKNELEAFTINKVNSLGIRALQNEFLQLAEGDK